MQDIKHHKESFFYTRFWIVVLVLFIALFTLPVLSIYKKYQHAQDIRNEYVVELEKNKNNKAKLEASIAALSTERGIEGEIRDRYRVVKQGEQMILIVNNKNDIQDQELKDEEFQNEKSSLSIFQKIINFFK